jgi:hypothetical protein
MKTLLLQSIKSLLFMVTPMKQNIFLQQIRKCATDETVILYEFPIVPSEAEKTTNLLGIFGDRPLLDCVYFAGISCHSLGADDVSQIFQTLLSERAFALLDRQLVLMEQLEYLFQVMHMLW